MKIKWGESEEDAPQQRILKKKRNSFAQNPKERKNILLLKEREGSNCFVRDGKSGCSEYGKKEKF